MAFALRCLARSATLTGLRRTTEPVAVAAAPLQIREYAAYRPLITDVDQSQLPEYEISSDPKEWKYVERLLPTKIVPAPKQFDGPAPSGWVGPKDYGKSHPYFVPRTKNHMLPVYLHIENRGLNHTTVVRKIQGDIWKLEQELRPFLETKLTTKYTKVIASRVNEMTAQIHFRGDFVEYTKKWLELKGF